MQVFGGKALGLAAAVVRFARVEPGNIGEVQASLRDAGDSGGGPGDDSSG